MVTEKPLIYDEVAAVLRDMPAIGKDSRAPGSMGGYAFRSIEDITAALKPLLAKHGIVMVPQVLERVDSARTVGSNRQMFVVDLHVQFTFYASDGSSFVASMWGEGTDMGDKATQKAVTSAFKSMLTVTFCIAEADSESFEVPQSSTGSLGEQAGAGTAGGAGTSPAASPANRAGAEAKSAASGEGFDSPRRGPAPKSDEQSAPAVPKHKRDALKARCVALAADGVSVAEEREHRGLPLVDSCDPLQFQAFEHMVDELEHELSKPFEKADA